MFLKGLILHRLQNHIRPLTHAAPLQIHHGVGLAQEVGVDGADEGRNSAVRWQNAGPLSLTLSIDYGLTVSPR
ncbi:MAG: hypothetical protein NXI12_13865 [Alphaproteobacteria bacterium]|nr:hypothetical protein [Alphaproteobacteria bacterium]